jgi:alkylation response protein AidB-like acyl-CoA dehydrogenase
MDLEDTPEATEYRREVRRQLTDAPAPACPDGHRPLANVAAHRAWQRTLAGLGLVGVSWPAEYGGQGRGPIEELIVDQELAAANLPGPFDLIGLRFLDPAIIAHGSEAQKASRSLPW